MSRVQVLIDDEGDRNAVAQLVRKRYEISTAEQLGDADLYLVDDHSMRQYRESLRERKEDAGSAFCPVVLVLHEGSRLSSGAATGSNGEAGIVDEILTAPIDEQTMFRRFDNLLTRRRTTRELTERNEQLEARKHELERYEAFVGESSDIFTALDESGRIQYQSPSIERILGYGQRELVGTDAFDLIHPADRASVREQFQALVEQPGGTVPVEARFRTATGDWRWLEIQGRNQLENEAIEAVITNSRDITERKREEEKRKRTVSRMTDAIMKLDEQWRFVDVNDRAETLLRNDTETLLGADIRELYPELVGSRFYDAYKQVMDEREYTTITELFDDFNTWFEVHVYPDPDGGISVYFRDVTEQRAREDRLGQLKREFETVFENVRDALFLFTIEDGDVRVRRLNGLAEDLVGEPTSRVRDQSLAEILDSEWAETLLSGCRRCLDERTTVSMEATAGDLVLDTQLAPVIVDEEVELIVGSARDVTERKQYERRLESQRDDLQLLNQMVRHDIRNDLQVIRTHAELLAERADGDTGESLERVVSASESAIELTREARELAEVMLHSEETHEAVDLAEVLIAQIDQARSTHEGLTVRAPESLPRVSVRGNDMLDSVFANLLHNAVVHNDGSPEIDVLTAVFDDRVEVTIADNGPGVPAELREEIFAKGERGTESDGSGVGLYLVSELVDAYGGTVSVQSRADWEPPTDRHDEFPDADRGAVFTVSLPRVSGE